MGFVQDQEFDFLWNTCGARRIRKARKTLMDQARARKRAFRQPLELPSVIHISVGG